MIKPEELEEPEEFLECQQEENNGDMFLELEKEYNIIVADMENDPNANQDYLQMYKALFDYAFRTREKNIETSGIIQDLRDKSATTSNNIVEAIKTINAHLVTIHSLNGRITDFHMLIDDVHSREQDAYEIIDNMQKTLAELEMELSRQHILEEPDLEDCNAMLTGKTSEQQEHDKLLSIITKLKRKLKQTTYDQEILEQRTDDNDLQVETISNELVKLQLQHDREKQIKFIKDGTLLNIKEAINVLHAEENELNAIVNEGKKEVLDLDKRLKQRYVDTDLCDKTLNAWNKKYCKLQGLANQSINELKLLEYENNKIIWDNCFEVKVMLGYQDTIEEIKNDKINMLNSRLQMEKDMEKIRESTKELSLKMKDIKMSDEKVKMFEYKREIIVLLRSRNNTINNIIKHKKSVTSILETISQREQVNSKLYYDIIMHAAHERQQRKQISFLEKERDRLQEDATDQVDSMEENLRTLKQLQNKILTEMTLEREQKRKLRILQKQYEMAIGMKVNLERDLRERRANNEHLNETYLNANFLVENSIHIIRDKDADLQNMRASIKALTQEVERMSKELAERNKVIRDLKTTLMKSKSVIEEFRAVVYEIGTLVKRNNEAIVGLISERDQLGLHLQKRNTELCLLYNKMEIVTMVSKHSSAEYEKRVNDIQLLTREIQRQRYWKQIFTQKIIGAVNLKEEIKNLETNLVKEKVKCKMIECDSGKTINVHRWRQLEWAKPDEFHLLVQVNYMQKRHVKVEQRLLDKKLQLKEVLQLYKNLRKVLMSQRGPGSAGYVKKKKQQLSKSQQFSKYINAQRKQSQIHNLNMMMELKKINQKLVNARKELKKIRCQRRG